MKTSKKTLSTLKLQFAYAQGQLEALSKEPLVIDFEEFYEFISTGTLDLENMSQKTVSHMAFNKNRGKLDMAKGS